MSEPYYLDMEDVVKIHARQIERFGGASGIRDPGLVQSALDRPKSGYYRDRIEEAAAMWESLTMNHGFVDGNKRVGFACTYVFLRANGHKMNVTATAATQFVLGHLEAGTFAKDNLDAWLRENTKPV